MPKEKIYVEGIEKITAGDIRFAEELGYRIKLLAIIRAAKRRIEVRVHPTLIPQGHVLASVGGVFNAVAVHGDVVGETFFYGRGAGRIHVERGHQRHRKSRASPLNLRAAAPASPRTGFTAPARLGGIVSQYYLHLSVRTNRACCAVAGILGGNGIGISSVIQPESTARGRGRLAGADDSRCDRCPMQAALAQSKNSTA